MPSVLPPLKGWRIVVYTNDHRPPHVHVVGPEQHARFELLCDLGRIQLMSNIGFARSELQTIADFFVPHLAHLCREWERIHGR